MKSTISDLEHVVKKSIERISYFMNPCTYYHTYLNSTEEINFINFDIFGLILNFGKIDKLLTWTNLFFDSALTHYQQQRTSLPAPCTAPTSRNIDIRRPTTSSDNSTSHHDCDKIITTMTTAILTFRQMYNINNNSNNILVIMVVVVSMETGHQQ